MSAGAAQYLAVDIGTTSLRAGVVSHGTVTESAVTAHPPEADATKLLDSVLFAIDVVLSASAEPVEGLAVSCPGPLKLPSGDVSPLGISAWRDFPLRDHLADRFGLPVLIDRDAVCLARGEQLGGRGNVLGVLCDATVTSGLVLHDDVAVDGDVAHVVVTGDSAPCRCGAHGCLAATVDADRILATAARGGARAQDLTDLVAMARRGDKCAADALHAAGTALGTALASAAALLDLDVAAIGGELSHAADLVMDGVFAAWERHHSGGSNRRCRVVLAAPDSVLIGAATLFRGAPETGPRNGFP